MCSQSYEGTNVKSFSDISRLQRGWWNRCSKEPWIEILRKSKERNCENMYLMIFLFFTRPSYIFCTFIFSEIFLYFYDKFFTWMCLMCYIFHEIISNADAIPVCFYHYTLDFCWNIHLSDTVASSFPFMSEGKAIKISLWTFNLKSPKKFILLTPKTKQWYLSFR